MYFNAVFVKILAHEIVSILLNEKKTFILVVRKIMYLAPFAAYMRSSRHNANSACVTLLMSLSYSILSLLFLLRSKHCALLWFCECSMWRILYLRASISGQEKRRMTLLHCLSVSRACFFKQSCSSQKQVWQLRLQFYIIWLRSGNHVHWTSQAWEVSILYECKYGIMSPLSRKGPWVLSHPASLWITFVSLAAYLLFALFNTVHCYSYAYSGKCSFQITIYRCFNRYSGSRGYLFWSASQHTRSQPDGPLRLATILCSSAVDKQRKAGPDIEQGLALRN